MNKHIENILYSPLYLFIWLHSLLPFKILYLLSDIIFLPLFYIIRYRRKLVYKNMRDSFPDKSEKEIFRMERSFYHHLCDYVVETIKLLHISDKETKKRFPMENTDVLQRAVDNNEQVILMLGHYGNWEYIPSITLWVKTTESTIMGEVYRPLNNHWFNSFFLKLRSRYNTVNIPKNDVFREFVKYRNEKRAAVVGFMADQTPSRANIYYWTEFLNHKDTPILTGIERIARKLGCTLVYADVIKIKRGYYKLVFEEITKEPKKYKEHEITEIYARLMEKTICRAPEYWLWTHNRWKHKRLD
ncbi:MAG: lysophospholipid acyltransferase family protein [Bacteroidales bacterium]